jgi:hypothetical protein
LRARLILASSVVSALAALSALADEPRHTIDASRALDAGTPVAPDIVITRTPPDPPALVERSQWVFDLRWDRGDVWLVGIHPLELPAPQATPRVMGRFALELFEGPTLIERARFDFPLLGASELDAAVSFTPKLRTRIGVVFPATRRGTRLELLDRASGRRWALPWPVSPLPAGEATPEITDAGALPAPPSQEAGRPVSAPGG